MIIDGELYEALKSRISKGEDLISVLREVLKLNTSADRRLVLNEHLIKEFEVKSVRGA